MDESVHIVWSQRLLSEGALRQALADGKLLQILAIALPVRLIGDPLLAARLVSVLAGAVGMWAVSRASARLFGERAGLAAGVAYLICPFTLFYDRLALADVFGASFAALCLLALAHAMEGKRGTALGFSMAGTVLSKVTGLFVLAWPAWALVVAAPPRWRRDRARALALAYVVALAFAVPMAWYFYTHTAQLEGKAAAASGLGARWSLLEHNVGVGARWLWTYWTPSLAVLGLTGVIVGAFRHRRAVALLAGATLIPVVTIGLVAQAWFPRYVLPATIPFLMLVAYALGQAQEWLELRWRAWPRHGWLVLLLLVAFPTLAFDRALLVDPNAAPLPGVERFQYLTHWPSGYGLTAAVAYVRDQRLRSPRGLTVAVDSIGQPTLLFALRAYFLKDDGVQAQSVDLDDAAERASLARSAEDRPTLLMLVERRLRQKPESALVGLSVEPGPTFFRPDGVAVARVYRLGRPPASAHEDAEHRE